MLLTKTHNTLASLVFGFAYLAAPSPSFCASPIKLSGAITGFVTDSAGIPQMGATAVLLNRQERIFEKVLTDERGEFKLVELFPDLYSIRVKLASFVPAFKANILLQPGARSILNVSLNSLFI